MGFSHTNGMTFSSPLFPSRKNYRIGFQCPVNKTLCNKESIFKRVFFSDDIHVRCLLGVSLKVPVFSWKRTVWVRFPDLSFYSKIQPGFVSARKRVNLKPGFRSPPVSWVIHFT